MAKSKIIIELAKGSLDIEIALKELKLLLQSFPDKKLQEWTNNELSGYGIDEDVPEYRRIPASLKGSFLFYNTSFKNVGIPILSEAPDVVKNALDFVEVRHSIRSLKDLEGQEVFFPIPSKLFPYIMEYSSMQMTALLDARLSVGIATIPGIISAVENKVLDAMLFLENQFGCLDELDIDLSNSTDAKVSEIEKQLSIIIYNDNSITIGDKNKITDSILSNVLQKRDENNLE